MLVLIILPSGDTDLELIAPNGNSNFIDDLLGGIIAKT